MALLFHDRRRLLASLDRRRPAFDRAVVRKAGGGGGGNFSKVGRRRRRRQSFAWESGKCHLAASSSLPPLLYVCVCRARIQLSRHRIGRGNSSLLAFRPGLLFESRGFNSGHCSEPPICSFVLCCVSKTTSVVGIP